MSGMSMGRKGIVMHMVSAAAQTAPTITSSAPTLPVYGVAYSHQYTATGSLPIAWTVSVGSLPTGLSLNESTGLLSGTPTQSGYFPFTVRAANAVGNATQAASWTIFILNAGFADTQAAPIPRTAEPGPGALTVVQNDGAFSIAAAKLAFTAQSSPAWGDQGFNGTLISRAAGLVVLGTVNLSTVGSGTLIGFSSAAGVAITVPMYALNLRAGGGSIEFWDGVATHAGIGPVPAQATDYQAALILKGTGVTVVIKGGVFTNWTILWSLLSATFDVYPLFSNNNGAGTVDSFRVRQLPSPFNSDYGLATLHQTDPSGVEYEGEADGIFDVTFTLPAGWAAGDAVGFNYRYVDSNNFWTAYALVNTFYVDSKVAGSASNRISVAGVFSAGQTYTIRVITQGSKHNAYTLNGTTWTKRGAEVDVVTPMDAEKTLTVGIVGTHAPTLTALDAWPRTLSPALATELDRVEDVTWLLRDDFTTAAAAGQIVRRPAVPGPGTLTYVQNDGQMSIGSDVLTFTAQTTPVWGDQGVHGTLETRATGKALLTSLSLTTWEECGLGWHTAEAVPDPDTYQHALQAHATDGRLDTVGDVTVLTGLSTATAYPIAVVLRSTGALLAVKIGSTWTLVWVSGIGNTASLYPAFSNLDGAGSLAHFRTRQLSAPFTTDYGATTQHVAAPADGTEYTGNADGITDLTVTAPAVLDGQATTRCGFYYRADADLTPAWHCYVDGAGAFRLDSIAADGTRTSQVNVAGVIAGGATVTLRSIHAAALHDVYTLAGTTWTKRGTQINVSLNDAITTIEPSIPAGWTVANLDDWPRTLSAALATELERS